MPSPKHELTLDLFRRRPALLAVLLRSARGVEVESSLAVRSETFAQLKTSSYAADVVLEGERDTLILEVQLRRDEEKLRSWPLYVASAHAATGKRTLVVVLALDGGVARWAARPIATFQDGSFCPIVLQGSSIPRVTDLEAARAEPELAVLSALAHGREHRAVEVGLAAWIGAVTVAVGDADRGKLYADAVLASLSKKDARALLEVVMKTEGFEYKSEWMRQNFAEGRAAGKAEGKAEGLREIVAALCGAHGLGWSDARAALVSAMSVTELERLVVRISADRRWPDDA